MAVGAGNSAAETIRSQKKIKAMDRWCTENKPILGGVLKAPET